MTTTAETLPTFEDEQVLQAQVRIVKAGDGLSEALKIAPKTLHLGDEVFYVLRGVVRQVNHRQKDYDEPLVRVHTVEAEAITEVDPKVANKMLAAAADQLEKARAEAQGQLALDAEHAAEDREAND